MKERAPDVASEKRLEEIRAEAERRGRVDGKGVRPMGAPFPKPDTEQGYYGLPLLKAPVWTWEIPTYFFVGGAAGATAAIAAVARATGADPKLVRNARWVAAAGATLSAPLLVADLGRPERFLNMLRVLKLQSPMSVGAWILTVFGSATAATVFLEELKHRTDLPVTLIGDVAGLFGAASGLGMATYTGVLLGATAIPAWARHASLLPLHFGASAVGSAVSVLELLGNDETALNLLGLGAAGFETLTGFQLERTDDLESEPLRHGMTGTTIRIGGLFSGPLPFLLRLLGLRSRRFRTAAAVSTLLGSLITRFAWVEAGKASARDPRVPLGLDTPEK